jgi:DNA-binding NarL/FixJ family response regulator
LRILVADDHQSVRSLVCDVLAAQEDWLVCGEATNGREGVEMALQLKPDVVILDISMPELNGLEAARQIVKTIPQTNVVILTMYDGEDLRRMAFESGASACVLKTDLPRLVMEIRTLFESQRHNALPGGDTAGKMLSQDETRIESDENLITRLTGLEREILRLLAQSKTTKEIAIALSIEAKAVGTSRSQIMDKLGMKSIVDLVQYARHRTHQGHPAGRTPRDS